MEYLVTASSLLPPQHLMLPLGWAGHIPFAFWLIEQARPSLVVELGTHYGNSYFAFCQGVTQCHVPATCYAVDTWEGDIHAGTYGDEVYRHVAAYNADHYADFSNLLRMSFDDALEYFGGGSVDLLHIDGLHTCEAVRHDFEQWLPKMSDRGIILLHDICVRERGFGVWRLWEELSDRFQSLSFDHAHGLGVLFTGKQLPPVLEQLAQDWKKQDKCLAGSRFFSMAGARILLEYRARELTEALQERYVRIQELADSANNLTATLNSLRNEHDLLLSAYRQIEREYQNMGHEFQNVLDSFSWKVTRPFRKLARSAGKRSRRIRALFSPGGQE